MGSTSTALGAGTSPVSAFTAGVFLGVGISIVAMGRLLQYVYEMGQRSSVAGDRANAETNEQNQANGIASSSSGDQTATTSTDVATLLLSPPNIEMLEVIVQSPPTSSTHEIAANSTSSSFLAQQMLWHLKWLHLNLLLPVQAMNQLHTSQWLMFLLHRIAWWQI